MLHIYEMLKHAPRHISFHTPGHKRGKWDITELSFSDNLSAPSGVILRAEHDIAEILGSARSFILTDGSTCGVLSMLYASKVRRLFVPRDSHRSVFHGCKLMGIEIVRGGEDGGELPRVTSAEEIEAAAGGIDGVLLTSPDYYGRIPDLKAIRAACDRHGLLLLIDGAHGGHLHGEAGYSGNYADLWVDGVHKSLPAFTQGAVVSARTQSLGEALGEAVDIFRTSSPSYPIMASVEYAVKAKKNEKVRKYAICLQKKCGIRNQDWTKLVVPFGAAADEAERFLEKRRIYAEFNDGNFLLFYLSDCNRIRELKRLDRLLCKLKRAPAAARPVHKRGERRGAVVLLSPQDAVGKTCAKSFGLFPPCIPLAAEGEIVTADDAARIVRARGTFGTEEGKISVYEG